MESSSGSVGSFHDDNENTLLNEKLDVYETDSSTEGSEAWLLRAETPASATYMLPRTRRYVRSFRSLMTALLPTSVQSMGRDVHHEREKKPQPTAYLDGMRGLAAFAVFLCHLTYSTFDITHSYGAGPPGQESENTRMLQLPIVRLFYSGPPMVAIFFVISGYALSYKPLKQMRNHDFEGLITTITSSVFRRALRLFLPCFASTFIVVCLTRLGVYQMTKEFANDMRAVHEDHYWTAPNTFTQIGDWAHKMLDFANVFDWSLYSGSVDLDRHLWTIPVEFRCSMALFTTQILVARMAPRLRMLTIVSLAVWGTYWNRWEMVPFWGGIVIAELDLVGAGHSQLGDPEKPRMGDPCASCRSFSSICGHSAVAVFSLFLLSYPDADGHLSPGYVWLTNMIPERYSEKHRFWTNLGAMLIVWSVGNLAYTQRIFTTRLLQYLGKISFPLYLCHGFVIHTFTYLSLDYLWDATDAYSDRARFEKTFALVALCTIGITVLVSDIFLRVVDVRCVRFARWLEGKFFAI